MPAPHAPTPTAFTADFLDVLAEARSAAEALSQVDRIRRLIAGDSIFSIQQNVTTGQDPEDEVLLRRFYSSDPGRFPVNGTKHKTRTPWTECLFVHGRVFVGEGADVLARYFEDYEQMRPFGLQSVVNVPLMQGNTCYATFNVFGTRAHWQPQEVLGIRLLALAAARWVPAAPGLSYRFSGVPASTPMEA